MKNYLLPMIFFVNIVFSQVGIGTANPRGALDINKETTNNMGLVLPTNSSPNNLVNPMGGSIAIGTIMYDSTLSCVRVFKSTGWSNCLCDQCGPTPGFTLDCSSGTLTGTFTAGTSGTGSKSINYTNATGQAYGAISVASTGVTGLTATAPAGNLANGNGNISLTISGTPSSAGTASFTVTIAGQTCTFTITVNGTSPVFGLDCSSGTLTGTYSSFTPSSGNKTINYTGGNGQTYTAISIASTGVTGLTATAPAGTLNGNGSVTLSISGTPSAAGTANFTVIIAGQTCTFTITVTDKFANIDQFTIIQIGNNAAYFPSGVSLIGSDATNGGTGSGNANGPGMTSGLLQTVLADLGKPVEILGLIPSSTSAQGLTKIFNNTTSDQKKREVVFIYSGYNANAQTNTSSINSIINQNYVSKGKIYFISADEGVWTTYPVFSANNYGKADAYLPTYNIDGTKLVETGETFPTKYGNVTSSGVLSSQYYGNSLVVPANTTAISNIISSNTATAVGMPILFKDMNYNNGKVWVFGDTDAYWQYDTDVYGAKPYLTTGCTSNTRQQFTCNMFHYVTRKNLGLPIN